MKEQRPSRLHSQLMTSTRSVDMNLARRFNAGIRVIACSRRVATIDSLQSQASLPDANTSLTFPGLERPG